MINNKEELHATITARAELDRAFARLLVEDAATVMSRNLVHLLREQDKQAAEQRAAFGALVKDAIGEHMRPIVAQVQALDGRLTARERDDQDLRRRVEAVEKALAARPSPEEAHATYDGVRRILDHLGLNDAASQ